jgi:septum formation protein
MKIILATASPYRREAFSYLDIPFSTETSNVEENFPNRPSDPEALVLELARRKAEAVARNHQQGIIFGFDSVGFFNGTILEKPRDKEEAFQRLVELSGKAYDYFSGIHMIQLPDREPISRLVKTRIQMRKLSSSEIEKYLDQDSTFTTRAVGFDPLKAYSSSFITRLEGSYHNVITGIPLEAMAEMLIQAGFNPDGREE